MRIAIIGSGALEIPKIGGTIRKAALRKVKPLCDSGHQVYVFDSKHAPSLDGNYLGLHIYKVPHPNFTFLGASSNFILTVIGLHLTMVAFSFFLFFYLWRILKKGGFDVIQTHIRYDAIAVVLVQRLVGTHVPLVFTCHNSDWQRDKLPLILRILFIPEKFAIRHASTVVAVSQTLKTNLVEKVPVAPEQIKIVYEKPDRNLFQPGKGGNAISELYLVCISDLIDRKNQLVLIKAMPNIVKYFPRAKLVFIGGTPDRSYLIRIRSTVEQFGISENIKIEGKVPHNELPNWLQKAAICLVPTQRESSPPLVLLEALSCKRAVVASRIPEIAELNGIIGQDVFATASPFRPEEWAVRIVEILKDAKKRQEYEENADKLISSLKDEAQQYIDIYRELVE